MAKNPGTELKKDSKFVRHEPCPSCGSSDAFARYSNGSGKCYSAGCTHYEPSTDFVTFRNKIEQESENAWVCMNNEKLTTEDELGVIAAIPDRRISQDTWVEISESFITFLSALTGIGVALIVIFLLLTSLIFIVSGLWRLFVIYNKNSSRKSRRKDSQP